MVTPVLLDAHRLRKRLVDDGPYAALDLVTVTGSTNTDLVAAAARGAADRTVLMAEEQSAGRGRMQRQWVSPRGYGLNVSVLLRPGAVVQTALAWVPLLAGIALAETVRGTLALPASLKWPNDLLIGGSKAAGILSEAVTTPDGMAVVTGMGINVHHELADLPATASGLAATSFAAQGVEVDREEFAVALLTAFVQVDDLWRGRHGDVEAAGLRDRYRELCSTLGQEVRVQLGEDSALVGTAEQVDINGRLVVRGNDGQLTPVSAGDVVHLRRE